MANLTKADISVITIIVSIVTGATNYGSSYFRADKHTNTMAVEAMGKLRESIRDDRRKDFIELKRDLEKATAARTKKYQYQIERLDKHLNQKHTK